MSIAMHMHEEEEKSEILKTNGKLSLLEKLLNPYIDEMISNGPESFIGKIKDDKETANVYKFYKECVDKVHDIKPYPDSSDLRPSSDEHIHQLYNSKQPDAEKSLIVKNYNDNTQLERLVLI